MARKDTEGLLGANFPREFVEDFWKNAAPEKENKQVIIKAMAKLWLELPVEMRRQYLYPSNSDKTIIDLIRPLIEQVLIEHHLIDKVFAVPNIHKKVRHAKNIVDKVG